MPQSRPLPRKEKKETIWGSVGEFDAKGSSRGSRVEDSDITDNRRPNIDEFDTTDRRSAEDFDGTDKVRVENFGTPPAPTDGGTKRRIIG